MSLLFRATHALLIRERALEVAELVWCEMLQDLVVLLYPAASEKMLAGTRGARGERCDGRCWFLSPGKTLIDFGGSF